MNEILRDLSGGDLRSEGRAAEVAARITARPKLLPALCEGLAAEDKLIRARTCMCLEIVSRTHPELLESTVERLLDTAEAETVPQARWHLAEILANVRLDRKQAERIVPTLLEYLGDRSKIVAYCAVQALGIVGKRSRRRKVIVAELERRRDASKSMGKIVAKALEQLGVVEPG